MVVSIVRGQGTFEYVLLLGGALLVVVVAVLVLQTNFQQASSGISDVQLKQCQAAASQAPSCSEGGQFKPENTFSSLSVQQETRCDCSDFSPDAFSVPIGQEGQLAGFSVLQFDDGVGLLFASDDGFLVSLVLPKGKYAFYAYPGGLKVEPEAQAGVSGGIAYSFVGVAAGNLKVVPLDFLPAGQARVLEEQALASKEELPPVSKIVQSKDFEISLDESTRFMVSGDRAVFSFSPSHDFEGGLSVRLPVSSTQVTRVFPKSAGVSPENGGGISRVSWDFVPLKAGEPFEVVLTLSSPVSKSEVDAAKENALSLEAVQGFGKWVVPERSVAVCALEGESCLPVVGGTCCGGLSCDALGGGVCKNPIHFGQPSPSSSPSPKGSVGLVPTASPSPEPVDCAMGGETCGGLLGGKTCCQGFSCNADLLGLITGGTCQGGDSTLPSPTPSTQPSVSPVDPQEIQRLLAGKTLVYGDPALSYFTGELASEKPKEPVIELVHVAAASTPSTKGKLEGEYCNPYAGLTCAANLECVKQNPLLASSRFICRAPKTGDALPLPESGGDSEEFSVKAFKDFDFAGKMTDFVKGQVSGAYGPNQPKGFIRDKKGDLYVVMQTEVRQEVKDEPYAGDYRNSKATFSFPVFSGAVSLDGGKTWTFRGVQKVVPQAQDQKSFRITTYNRAKEAERMRQYEKDHAACVQRITDSCLKYTTGDKAQCPQNARARCDSEVRKSGYSRRFTAMLREVERVDSDLIGAAPAPEEGIYIFYEVIHRREQFDFYGRFDTHWSLGGECVEKDGSFSSECSEVVTYQRPARILSSERDVRALHLSRDGVVEDVLVSKALDVPKTSIFPRDWATTMPRDYNVVFLGYSNDKYYFCTGESPGLCGVYVEPTLFETEKPGKPLKKIGVFGQGFPGTYEKKYWAPTLDLPAATVLYKPYSDFLVDSRGTVYGYNGKISLPSTITALKGKEDFALHRLEGGSFVKAVDSVFAGFEESKAKSLNFRTVSSAFDSKSNLHMVVAADATGEQYGVQKGDSLYYRMIPASALDGKTVASSRVYVFDQGGCAACEPLKKFLDKAKVSYSQSGLDSLPQDIQLAVHNQFKAAPHDPVVVLLRSGTDFDVVSGFKPTWLVDKLGLLVDFEKIATRKYPVQDKQGQRTVYPDGCDPYFPYHTTPSADCQGKKEPFTYQYNLPAMGPHVFLQTDGTPAIFVQDGLTLSRLSLDSQGQWKSVPVIEGISSQVYACYNCAVGILGRPDVGLPQGPAIRDESQVTFYIQSSSDDFVVDDIYWFKAAKYNFYHLGKKSSSFEPVLSQALSELVPYQHFSIALPFHPDAQPTVELDVNEPVVSAKISKHKSGFWLADVKVDARGKLSGGRLDFLGVSGQIKASAGSLAAPIPLYVPVQGVVREDLAYAAPDNLVFYTSGSSAVKKQVALVNNYPFAVTLSCGSVFSQQMPAHSVKLVDVSSTDASCALAVDGKATQQKMSFQRKGLPEGVTYFAEQDVLAERLDDLEKPATFKDAASYALNCFQAQQALNDFEYLVALHTGTINGQAVGSTVSELYPNGWMEKMVLRTGVFDDLDERKLDACTALFGNFEVPLKPGHVYEIALKVPLRKGWLAFDARTPTIPTSLLPQWSYATPSGAKSDQNKFVELVGVRFA